MRFAINCVDHSTFHRKFVILGIEDKRNVFQDKLGDRPQEGLHQFRSAKMVYCVKKWDILLAGPDETLKTGNRTYWGPSLVFLPEDESATIKCTKSYKIPSVGRPLF